nr:MAG: hypothetical protein [Caudoviricetes sp.]
MFGGAAIFAIAAVVSFNIRYSHVEAEAVKSGLQQCVVKVNDKEEIVWKKECHDEN